MCVLLLVIFSFCGQLAAEEDYGYPIHNPLAATIIGTPAEYKAGDREGGDG